MAMKELSDVLSALRTAKEELNHAVVPLWAGVQKVALFTHENRFMIFDLTVNAERDYGYFVCEYDIESKKIKPIKEAGGEEISKYLSRLTPVAVDLADDDFAFITSAQDRLLGIYEPAALIFGENAGSTAEITARYDGVNLFYDHDKEEIAQISDIQSEDVPLLGLFNDYAAKQTLSFDGLKGTDEEGEKTNEERIHAFNHEFIANGNDTRAHRVRAMIKSLGGDLIDFSEEKEGIIARSVTHFDSEKDYLLPSYFSPVSSGVAVVNANKTDSTKLINFVRESLKECVKQL